MATHSLPRSAAHPFYARLNQILDQHDFAAFVEGLCERFYADDGRLGLPPGRYFRLTLSGTFLPLIGGPYRGFHRASVAPSRNPPSYTSACEDWLHHGC